MGDAEIIKLKESIDWLSDRITELKNSIEELAEKVSKD